MSDDLYIGPTALSPGPKEPRISGDSVARIVFIPLLVILSAIVLVFFVLLRPVAIEGPSMAPTLTDTERVLVTHGDKNLAHGDVVITSVLEGSATVRLVKRVIGLPGDTVEIRNDVAIINGTPEPARGQAILPDYAMSSPPVTILPGMVYVMGDNRAVSSDSRIIGPVPISGIDGKVVAVFAPFNRIRLIN